MGNDSSKMAEEMAQREKERMAEEMAQREKERMATGSLESIDSGVSLKSDQSKAGLIDFKDRVSPRSDFSSSEEEHGVSDDEDLVKSSDDQEEMNQELSSEVG